MNPALSLRAWCLLGLSSWCSHLRRAWGYWVGRNLVHKEGFAPWQQKIREVRSKTVFNQLHSIFMYTGNCWSQQRWVKIAWGSDFPKVTWEGCWEKCCRRGVKDLGTLVWQRGQKGEVVELFARGNLQNQGTVGWWIRDKSSLELMDIQGIYGNQENGVCDRHKGGNKRKYSVGLLVFWVLSWIIQERKEGRES